jgi:hypothetical protein
MLFETEEIRRSVSRKSDCMEPLQHLLQCYIGEQSRILNFVKPGTEVAECSNLHERG